MYSDTDILAAMKSGSIEIGSFNENQLGTNSYDVRLGNTFYKVFWDNEGPYFEGPYVYMNGDKVNVPISGTLLGVTAERIGTSGKVVAELRSKSSARRIGITTNCDAGLGDVGYNDVWTMEFTAFSERSLFWQLVDHFGEVLLQRILSQNLDGDNDILMFGVLNQLNKMLMTLLPGRPDTKPFLIVGQPVAQMVFCECKSAPTKEYDGQYTTEWPLNMIPAKYRHRVIAPK